MTDPVQVSRRPEVPRQKADAVPATLFRRGVALLLAAAPLCAQCELLLSWDEYRASHHPVSYIVRIEAAPGGLLFIGARHTSDPADPQIARIERLWAEFHPQVAFSEGGIRPASRSREEAVERYGEPGLLRFLAERDRVPPRNLEPPNHEEAAALAREFDPRKVKLFYLLRYLESYRSSVHGPSIEQYAEGVFRLLVGDWKLAGPPRTLDEFEEFTRRSLPALTDWRRIPPTWFNPLRQDNFLNELARRSGSYRDCHMLPLIAAEVRAGRRVLVIAGSAHAVRLQFPKGGLKGVLTLHGCRERQLRLLARMAEQGLSAAVVANPKNVYYLTGALNDPALSQVFALTDGGRSVLITNVEPAQYAADRVERYTAYTLERPFLRHTMHAEATALLARFLPGRRGAIGLESDAASTALSDSLPGGAKKVNLTPTLLDLRRRKDSDEIECIRAVTRLAEAGYGALKSRLEPGMTECDAYLVFLEAMVRAAGTSVDLRGDFAAGTRAINGGGPPTGRLIERGDLYILDIFPFYQGYSCDLCRTFVVGEPSQLQRDAWEHVMAAHRIVERSLRPGVKGRELYEEVRAHMESFAPAKGSFTHHLGHGVGMDAWEFPWLTPGSDQEIREGDLIAVEPGLYSAELRGGIRLERNYLAGAGGVTPLDVFSMDL